MGESMRGVLMMCGRLTVSSYRLQQNKGADYGMEDGEQGWSPEVGIIPAFTVYHFLSSKEKHKLDELRRIATASEESAVAVIGTEKDVNKMATACEHAKNDKRNTLWAWIKGYVQTTKEKEEEGATQGNDKQQRYVQTTKEKEEEGATQGNDKQQRYVQTTKEKEEEGATQGNDKQQRYVQTTKEKEKEEATQGNDKQQRYVQTTKEEREGATQGKEKGQRY
ncbi:hypothetical protein RHGRI_036567 [Rhododendron griersonianum]|uniref:Uncharacterized protein n=1 Tax=Rhododendron griersonianum TaxID=479676 RepID=A0AAV6HTV6_9ERIC|nr:hypothetical protein RHGRI_036567 [Rhododendron griersonianum]